MLLKRYFILFSSSFYLLFLSCQNPNEQYHVFFLHNRFLETHELNEVHPQYGKVEYQKIIDAFEKENIKVISEKRIGNTDTQEYARQISRQINNLISAGVPSEKITVIGTSKGGYIAQYVSTYLNNPNVNFVFIASFQESDIENFPEINYCGNILTIFEKSDPFGVSAIQRKETSTCEIQHFKEIELNNGLNHGFIFQARADWIEPCLLWASGKYEED